MKDKKLEIRITGYEMRQLEQEAAKRGMTCIGIGQKFDCSVSRTRVVGCLRAYGNHAFNEDADLSGYSLTARYIPL